MFRGRNIVIQGPPGTGKSQTIANIIAAALAKGKTVLFVSEKLAALEVVRRRLDEAGLGVFCLELHSHKTQKQSLLQDLEERLARKGTFADPAGLDQKIAALERNKRKLLEYVTLMNRPHGPHGHTIFEILWARDRMRLDLPFPSQLVDSVVLRDIEGLTGSDWELLRQGMRIYADQFERVLGGRASLKLHPWYGVRNASLDYFGEQVAISALESYVRRCGELLDVLGQCGAVFGVAGRNSVAEIQQAAEITPSLPVPVGKEAPDLFARLEEHDNRGVVEDFLTALLAFRAEVSAVSRMVADWTRIDAEVRNSISFALQRAADLGIQQWSSAAVLANAKQLEEICAHTREAAPFVDALLRALEVDLEATVEDISALSAVSEILSSRTPFEALSWRCPGLEEEPAAIAIRAAASEAQELHAMQAELEGELFLDLVGPVDELREHVAVLETAGFLERCFSRRYRAAKRYYKKLRKATGRVKHAEALQVLRRLLSFFDRRWRFRGHNCWNYLPAHAQDVEVPWSQLTMLVQWYAEVQTNLPAPSGVPACLRRALFSMPSSSLREAQRLVQARAAQLAKLTSLRSGFEAIRDSPPCRTTIRWDTGFNAFAEALESVARDLHQIARTLESAGIAMSIALCDVPQLLARVEALRQAENSINQNRAAATALGNWFAGTGTDVLTVKSSLELANQLAQAPLPLQLKAWLFKGADLGRFRQALTWSECLIRHCAALSVAWDEFTCTTQLNTAEWFRDPRLAGNPPLNVLRQRAMEALSAQAQLSEWLEYLKAEDNAQRLDLSSMILLAQSGTINARDLEVALNYVLYNSLAHSALRKYPQLAAFSGATHEHIRADFQRLDAEVMRLWRARIASQIDMRPVPHGLQRGPVSHWTDLALIRHEIAKKGRHIPIRQLVRRAGEALQALKPCFMMGPLSVAQYLPPGQIEFDLVVMDEASQLKTEEGIGAVARGKQLVVVGDPQQLPPTTFFERNLPGDEDWELAISAAEEGESILDIAAAVWAPVHKLIWHYRSRHHSLIAFSNREFYNNDLIVFPAAHAKNADLGVKYVRVANGVYQSGKNTTEARVVVDAIVEHMRLHPNESLGVATMNFEQCELIDELLDAAMRDPAPLGRSGDPFVQSYIERWQQAGEPFFVKNLENVQGDERDVVFISMTYGQDTSKKFYQRFGPINGPTGHRRLNVLFTRARKRTVVFTSMDPDWIRIDESSSRGTRVLKAYLEYARSGILQQPEGQRGQPESDFEVSVAAVLKENGYEPVPQVGVAGYFIDIAVRHPKKAGTYIVGIECDGASYHAARSVRDRDRLRQMVLESLGWRIYRIWSTDWFKSRQREVQRLLRYIGDVLRAECENELKTTDVREGVHAGSQYGSTCASLPSAVAAQSQTERLRKRLLALRTEIVREFPSVPSGKRLLRGEMLEEFIQKRPANRREWLTRIRRELREATDLGEMREYLPKVLEICGEASEYSE